MKWAHDFHFTGSPYSGGDTPSSGWLHGCELAPGEVGAALVSQEWGAERRMWTEIPAAAPQVVVRVQRTKDGDVGMGDV